MQVSASSKTIKLIGIFALIMALFLGSLIGKEIVKCKDYSTVTGEVISTSKTVDYGQGIKGGKSIVKRYTTRYEADGVSYETTKRTFFLALKHQGKNIKVRYNPQSPDETSDSFLFESAGLGILFFGFFAFIMAKMHKIAKNKKINNIQKGSHSRLFLFCLQTHCFQRFHASKDLTNIFIVV